MGARRSGIALAAITIGAAMTAAAVLGVATSRAADHVDSPAASADPTADLTDVFAWTSADGSKVNLVLDVYTNAPATAKFSDQVLYAFHVGSHASFGATAAAQTDVVCGFDAAQTVSCWVGSADYVTGNAAAPAGLASASGKLRVFAGVRDDPFFFNLAGFNAAVTAVEAAAPTLTFDAAGCPAVDATTSAALVTKLRTDTDGSAAKNFFAGFNVLALVVQVDKALLTSGGGVLSVWASTNHRS